MKTMYGNSEGLNCPTRYSMQGSGEQALVALQQFLVLEFRKDWGGYGQETLDDTALCASHVYAQYFYLPANTQYIKS